MLENDYDIEIITTYKFNEKPSFDFNDNIKIKYLINENPTLISIKKLLKEKKIYECLKELIRRKKLNYLAKKKNIKEIKNLKTDYVITTRIYHNELVNKYLKDNNIITISTEHNYHNNDKKYINKYIKSVSNFDYAVECTDELYDFYKDKIKGVKVVKIYNAVDIKDNDISKLDNKQIISVGRLSSEKGFIDLIETMKLVNELDKEIKLVICGDGYEREKIENKIKEYNLENNIFLKGFLKEKELNNEYKKSSLYVMPSLSEAFGLVLLEGMHFGLPIIAFDTASGARNLLKDGTGILIKDRNIKELSKSIVSLINDKEKLKKYQEKSLKVVKNYSIDVIKKEWIQLLKEK